MDGRPNRSNKATSSNFSGVLGTLPYNAFVPRFKSPELIFEEGFQEIDLFSCISSPKFYNNYDPVFLKENAPIVICRVTYIITSVFWPSYAFVITRALSTVITTIYVNRLIDTYLVSQNFNQ